MLTVTVLDQGEYPDRAVFLRDTEAVEREFLSILNFRREAFRDEDSLALMEAIDSAKRQGDYGVVTPFGESCITCLSTGCKFGLLMLYYRKYKQVKPIVQLDEIGSNVWKWLSEHADCKVYTYDKEELWQVELLKHAELLYEDHTYQSRSNELSDMVNKLMDDPYTMTRESEEKAYERAKKMRDEEVFIPLKETIGIEEFISRFPESGQYFTKKEDCEWGEEDWDWEEQRENEFRDFTVINYCSSLPVELPCYKHPLCICGTKGKEVTFSWGRSVKDPLFLELLFYDVLDASWWSEKEGNSVQEWCKDLFDSWFVLVINSDRTCRVEDYAKLAMFGFEVEKEKRQVTIYKKEQAVERFHELFVQTNGEESD